MFKYYGGSTENNKWNGFFSDDQGDLTIQADENSEIIFFHLNFSKDNKSYSFKWKLKGKALFSLNPSAGGDNSSALQTFPSSYVIGYIQSQAGDLDVDQKTFILDMVSLNDKLQLSSGQDLPFQWLLARIPFGKPISNLLERIIK